MVTADLMSRAHHRPRVAIEIDLAGSYRLRISGGIEARRCGWFLTYWNGDDPGSSGVRVWLAVGRTDMRRGMNGLALQVQQALGRDPHAGDFYVFQRRQRRPD